MWTSNQILQTSFFFSHLFFLSKYIYINIKTHEWEDTQHHCVFDAQHVDDRGLQKAAEPNAP